MPSDPRIEALKAQERSLRHSAFWTSGVTRMGLLRDADRLASEIKSLEWERLRRERR